MLYRCKLINKKGYVEENFLRDGESIEEVKEGLEIFEWPDGKWDISQVEGE
jgi:hypothetical protein